MNIYMNEFDQWMKRTLYVRHYVRYADVAFLSCPATEGRTGKAHTRDPGFSEARAAARPASWQGEHRNVCIRCADFWAGSDFLVWPLGTANKHEVPDDAEHPRLAGPAVLASYRGLLGHGNAFGLRQKVENAYGLFRDPYEEAE